MHGIEPDTFEKLIADPVAAGIDEKLLPLLAYAKKLTLAPASVTKQDAAAVYAAGWDEKALFHAISVTGLFNLMNRLVEGTGITANPMMREISRNRIAKNLDNPAPYAAFAKMVRSASESGILGDKMVEGE